jgi:phytoene synthase
MDKNIKIIKRNKLDSKKIMSNGSKSFFAASRLFPKRLRESATVIYSYCRLADDLVDFGGGKKAIIDLKHRLSLIYDGHPSNLGVDKEFSKVVLKYHIPKELPEALIEGFEWDVIGKEYETIEELSDYAARVAGSVGGMIAVLMGVRDPKVLTSACQLGLAMQLTNIARDVGEDAKNKRLYLPKEWMKEKGINTCKWKDNPTYCTKMAEVIQKLLTVADDCYKNSTLAFTHYLVIVEHRFYLLVIFMLK